MDFFTHQDKARKQTGILAVYFLIAISLIVVAINLVVFLFLLKASEDHQTLAEWATSEKSLQVSVGILCFFFLASLFKFYLLLGGGKSVAEMAGGTLVDMSSADPNTRRFISVTEEMAIASGMTMPELYIMHYEPHINAFVAGSDSSNTVLVVTRGCIEQLNRDELQGVIAHEFSHIFNGDMRMNLRLMSILAGILLISHIGEVFMRGGFFPNKHYGHNKHVGFGAIFCAGLALTAIGYIGLFFGRLIKAAVSRQREFLADASSVQFTRNPSGLAEAFLKIKGNSSHLHTIQAEDMSHMCFSDTLHFSRLFATHPPINERITAIDPTYLARGRAREHKASIQIPEQAMGFAGSDTDTSTLSLVPLNTPSSSLIGSYSTTTAAIAASVGNPKTSHIEYAHNILELLPEEVRKTARHTNGAKAIVYALLLNNNNCKHDSAYQLISDYENNKLAQLSLTISKEIIKSGARLRVPLTDISIPALRKLSLHQREQFLSLVEKLITVDHRYTLFEFVLFTILSRHLGPQKRKKKTTNKIKPVLKEVNTLISLLCHASGQNDERKIELHKRIMSTFSKKQLTIEPAGTCNIQRLREILLTLNQLNLLLKKPLLASCADCVLDDGKIQVAEAELIRAVSDSLGCPMPPMIT